MKINLSKPLVRDGQTIDSIDLDLDKLSGRMIVEAEKEARALGENVPNPLFSSLGAAIIASKVSSLKMEDVLDLAGPDFTRVTTLVTNFLHGWD